ncbi:hypothetical protein [Halomonas sp. PBN3]|nr:hypothetical protein [Halomonas sp. PBN3]
MLEDGGLVALHAPGLRAPLNAAGRLGEARPRLHPTEKEFPP